MKAVIAMSGGVDSSVAALLMKNEGHICVGATMQLYSEGDCSDAKAVADKLGMPFYIFPLKEEFKAQVIDKFIEFKHNPEKIVYAHPLLEPILSQTYGCIVYQEQVMRIVQDLAGYTLGQADMVRRMMGKKKVEAMAKEEKTFVYGKPESVDSNGKVNKAIDGCLKRGVPENVAKQIWNEMKDFAKYAFNKSHAAAYSLVTYQTAYLKTYYEPEFLTAVLNNRITKIEEITNYVTYAKSEKIPVLQPDINESKTHFTTKNGK